MGYIVNRRYEAFVGLRYLRSRGKNRFISFISLISMLGITIGVAVLIVVLSVMNGFEKELRERILSMTAHATVTGLEDTLTDWPVARESALQHSEVTAAAPFVEGRGMLVYGEAVGGVSVRGVKTELERTVSGVEQYLTAGSLETLEPGDYNMVVGDELARALGIGPGDRVILLIPLGNVTPAGMAPRMKRFTVSGVFKAGMYEYDRTLALINFEDATRLFRTRGEATGVRLTVSDLFRAPSVVREVGVALGGGVYVNDWTRSHTNFFRSIQTTKSIMFVILLLVVAVAAFNIVSTLVMVVKDKQGDIAIMRTIGATRLSITQVFMVQGTLIGLIGTLFGLLLGVVLALNLAPIVAGLEAMLGFKFLAPDVYFISDLPAHVELGDIVRICATAFFLALLSTLYPAWRAARTQPAEALRYEY